jgi:hypothetical protein
MWDRRSPTGGDTRVGILLAVRCDNLVVSDACQTEVPARAVKPRSLLEKESMRAPVRRFHFARSFRRHAAQSHDVATPSVQVVERVEAFGCQRPHGQARCKAETKA